MDAELQRGLLPGMISLSGKLLPAMRAVAYQTCVAIWEVLQVRGGFAASLAQPLRSRVHPSICRMATLATLAKAEDDLYGPHLRAWCRVGAH